MEYTRFGSTGLQVSRLCLGTMTFGYQCDEPTSAAIMDRAYEAGITFFDTADAYPLGGPAGASGTTEDYVGRWMQRAGRDNIILATKCFAPTGPNRWDQGNSRKNIMRAVEASLRRLQTDYIDLYQVHFWDANTSIDETVTALHDLVQSGKVRYVGCSNFTAYQLARSIGRAEALRLTKFVSVQPRYNLLYREIERELLPGCQYDNIAVIPYNPIAGGMLSGKHVFESGPTEGTRFTLGNASGRYQNRYWHQPLFEMVEALQSIASDAGMSLVQLAVAWVLANPAITAPIIGASKPDQLADSIAAAAAPLDPAVKSHLDQLTAIYRRVENER